MTTIKLLTQEEAASALRMSTRTLQELRSTGQGPDYLRIGRSVFYGENQLHDWIKEQACVCPSCNGRGTVEENECPTCSGTGRVR